MSNTIGTNIKFTLFGESHGSHIGFCLEGLKPGIKVDTEEIKRMLSLRRPSSSYETQRVEEDNFEIISGVFNGYTNGNPLTLIIENKNVRSADYQKTSYVPRPSHADYVSHIKYQGYEDYRGGGHFSGRLTACLVACAGIILPYLASKNIYIGTHIKEIKDVKDVDFLTYDLKVDEIINLNQKAFPVISNIKDEMEDVIKQVALDGDSIGGVLQTVIKNVPVGIGEPWFDALESNIAKAVFGIGAVKGIEFGEGFNFKNLKGSEAKDEYIIKDGKIETITNHNGGVNGGITNGMPIVFNTAIKPTPSIYKPLKSFDLLTLEETTLEIKGRHDPAIIRRIAIVITSITSIVLLDLLQESLKW